MHGSTERVHLADRLASAPRVSIVLALLLISGTFPAGAATITLHAGCSLIQAINGANGDSPVGGCTAGSGADTIVLVGDVDLTTIDNTNPLLSGGNGLPIITSDITIEGNGYRVARASSSLFRIFFISATGSLTLRQVIVEDGEIDSVAGCIYTAEGGSLTMDRSVIRNCSAYRSGGIHCAGGTVVIDRSYLESNTVAAPAEENAYGAALSSYGGDLTVRRSTFYGNIVLDSDDGYLADGGAMRIVGGAATIESSTFSSNIAADEGGAVSVKDLWFISPPPVVQITHSTFYSNLAGGSGAAVSKSGGQVTLTANIVTPAAAGACDGSFLDGGDNFGCLGGPVVTNLESTLQDNGGSTKTHALLAGSNAIEAAIPCHADLDQRGFVRDENCDSGAFEYTDCEEVQLQHYAVAGPEVFEEECSLSAGPDWTVEPGGNATLRAGRRVVLNEGFVVKIGGHLTVEIDPGLLGP